MAFAANDPLLQPLLDEQQHVPPSPKKETPESPTMQRPNFSDAASVERLFIQAVERGDRKAIIFALENAPDLNINCTDQDDRSALLIAIENGNSDIVQLLLDHNVQLGDCLLRAVDEQFVQGVRLICEHIKKKNIPECLNCKALNGDFHPDVTPLVLAAQHNHYDIIRILLEYGARIKDPRDYSDEAEMHTLENSVGMLNLYKALASQAYISQTSSDPFSTTFELCAKLRKLARTKYEFCDQFQELVRQCEDFSAGLLDHVRDSNEQAFILNHDPYGWSNPSEDLQTCQPNRVKAAIFFEQRKFVAHPHCQQRLIEQWYHGLPGWRDQSSLKSGLIVLLMGIGFPILSLAYIFFPYGRLGRFLRIPYVKFVCHTASQLFFLVLLLYQTIVESTSHPLSALAVSSEEEIVTDSVSTTTTKAQPPSIVMLLIVAWVAGMTWSKCKELWYNGSRFFNNLWNYFDFVTLVLYWTVIALLFMVFFQSQRGTAAHQVVARSQGVNTTDQPTPSADPSLSTSESNNVHIREDLQDMGLTLDDISNKIDGLIADQNAMNSDILNMLTDTLSGKKRTVIPTPPPGNNSEEFARLLWKPYDPILVAEALFALAKVMSFMRMICLTVINRHVGPMQISLGGMMMDIAKFLIIFCFVWFAFSMGMNQLYWYYSKHLVNQPFGSLMESMGTLFWALFGLPDYTIVGLPGINHHFTEGVGHLLYAVYHIIAIVVLLNVLIAMMSNTYTRVEMDADIEWKFSRSKLWMSYFDELGTVPPPLNIIPTPKSIYYFVRWLFCDVCCREDLAKKYKERLRSIVDERQMKFREVSEQVVRRYHFEKRHQEEEDDQANILNELKQDISGFKYDMFEALSEMDKKIREVDAKVNDKDVAEEGGLGTGMFKALQDAMKEPERRDSMISMSSGCSIAMVDMKSARDNTNSEWMEQEDDIELRPLVNSTTANKEEEDQPPNGLAADRLMFIDDDDALGSHRNTEV
ncbi:transient receptor potential-gamma protein-like isoform X3 [Acanthaster planci]|uniref:Transient receptor potential-gamma protein-like isoform X3 n=1 Tax=Acanthaster planci TaxID=133434 RepID=A0A8B7XWC8_ACAPL|nr:transient receptor potential-gamma protein-like isoform X3 [Acanthaster planci]